MEPDKGGEALVKALGKSRHRAGIKVARLDGFKDVSELHCRAPERFHEVLKAALAAAEPLGAVLARLQPEPVNKVKAASLDEESERKPSQADIMVRLSREAAMVFIGLDDTPFAAIEVSGHREVWGVRSRSFRSWMIHRFFTATSRAPSADVIAQAQLTLEAIATFEGEKHPGVAE